MGTTLMATRRFNAVATATKKRAMPPPPGSRSMQYVGGQRGLQVVLVVAHAGEDARGGRARLAAACGRTPSFSDDSRRAGAAVA